MSSSNDLVLVDQVLSERSVDHQGALAADKIFEIFACEQVVDLGDLTVEEVTSGVIGGSNDGGIDGVYVFLAERLLTEDSEIFYSDFKPASIPKGTPLTLWLVQAKQTPSFTETAIDLVASSTQRFLDLSKTEEDLKQLYCSEIVEHISRFRRALTALATRHPHIDIRFSYVTRGDSSKANKKVLHKAEDLKVAFSDAFPGSTSRVEILGAAELWQRYNVVPSYTLKLPYRESITHGTSHLALVALKDYRNFLSDDTGRLHRHIFDWNVRDYQGSVEVNKEIKAALLDPVAPEFWWLNNGVTIVCSKVSTVGKEFSLDDVQIVNGLQTSHTVHETLGGLSADHPAHSRLVQVRILLTEDIRQRDQVIRATNRQTSVPAASLHATDEIQRKIESYFKENDWYYDRRKNYYRNAGKPLSRIVSIAHLAQAVAAMGLSEPHNARARPSSLLKNQTEYSRMFSDETPLSIYLWLIEQQHIVDTFLAKAAETSERINLRFHLAMLSAALLMGKKIRKPAQLLPIAEKGTHSSEADLEDLLASLQKEQKAYAKETGNNLDKIAKGPTFVVHLLNTYQFL